jgi:hypothetical protein
VKKREPLYIVENSMEHLQKTQNKLPHDPAVSLLGIYPKELKLGSQRGI